MDYYTLAAVVAGAFTLLWLLVWLVQRVLDHLNARLLCRRDESRDRVRVAEMQVEVAKLRYGPKTLALPLTPGLFPGDGR